PNGEDAAKAANTFAQAYIDTMVALHVEPMQHAAEWFQEQLKTLTADLKAAQDKATEYQQRRGIVSTDEHADTEHTQLAELSTQLVQADEQVLEARGREDLARRALGDDKSIQELPDTQATETLRRLDREVADGEAKLLALRTRYGE